MIVDTGIINEGTQFLLDWKVAAFINWGNNSWYANVAGSRNGKEFC